MATLFLQQNLEANSTAASFVEESDATTTAERPSQVSHEEHENGNSEEGNEKDPKEFSDEGVEKETTGGGDNGTDDGNTHIEKENET